ncbi:FCD domain-containing protein [Haematobacter genomosp. 1]|uniref:FCD domain-containing protein n=1 Tax=Haematobacter genomosp. 1 TaxID=366618 RepID=UPI00211B2C35|nr:FCD domain-containing protein [Haematobacter genomosp. 1]
MLEQLVILAARLATQSATSKTPLLQIAVQLGDLRPSVSAKSRIGPSGHALRNVFYVRLLEASGNSELIRAVPFIRAELLRAQVAPHLAIEHPFAHAADYLAIAQAIVDARADAAAEAVSAHFQATRIFLSAMPDHIFAPT